VKGWLFLTKCGIIDSEDVWQSIHTGEAMGELEHKTTVRIPEKLHRAAKARAALEGRTFSAVIRELLEKWLEESEEDNEKA
jgi:predicted DNA binding CopG/RHH family protein